MSRMNDIHRCARSSLLTIALAASCACGLFGPSESIEGLWQGTSPYRGGSIPSRTIYLTLHQDDDRITGYACTGEMPSSPVFGTYPHVKFDRWEGKLEKSGAIVSTKISDFETFRRTDNRHYDVYQDLIQFAD
jgi:hypothetical protein